MKWIFLLLLIVLCPVFTTLVRKRQNQCPIAFAMGFLPSLLSVWHLYVAPISAPYWPGHTKGFELSLIDSLALAVLFGMPRLRGRTPLLLPFVAYILIVTVTAFWAIDKMAALFYAFQLIRMLVVYLAALRLSANPKAVSSALAGGAAALAIQAFYAVQQHFHGQAQAAGTLGAQNMLGIMTNATALPCFALLVVGSRRWFAKLAPALAVVLDVLTASRATLGFAALGFVGLLGISGMLRWTSRKAMMFGTVILVAVVVSPIALQAISKRSTGNNVNSSDEEREAFKRAAWLMIGDHPLGVGANSYVVVSNIGGYSDRAGVVPTAGSRSTSVHNTYLLILAETGYLGLTAVALIFCIGISSIFRSSFSNRHDQRGEMALGFAVTLLVTAFHLNYEWLFVTFQLQYVIFLNLGFGMGLARLVTLDAKTARRKRLIESRSRKVAEASEVRVGIAA